MSVEAKPYEQVDGLKEIYVSLGKLPQASFVFETAVKAQKAQMGVARQMQIAYMHGRSSQSTDNTKTDLLEVLPGSNLSKNDACFVCSYSAKDSGTAGKPIESARELLHKVGKAMAESAPSKEINHVDLIAVDLS